jgi:hypothetical protein
MAGNYSGTAFALLVQQTGTPQNSRLRDHADRRIDDHTLDRRPAEPGVFRYEETLHLVGDNRSRYHIF